MRWESDSLLLTGQAPCVKSLQVIQYASLIMKAQLSLVVMSAFNHLQLVRQLVPCLSSWDLATITHAKVTSRLDYCDILYAGLTLKLTQKLQQVQNMAAHVLTVLPVQMHIQPMLHQLHWLLVKYWIMFKVMVLTVKPSVARDHISLRPFLPICISQSLVFS